MPSAAPSLPELLSEVLILGFLNPWKPTAHCNLYMVSTQCSVLSYQWQFFFSIGI
jgi:hypothetical protein